MKSSHLIPALVIFLLAGCTNYQIVADPKDENYLSYDHPYTDEALAETLANARKICGQRKQVPIQTSNVCNIKTCATNYQCMDPKDVQKYGY